MSYTIALRECLLLGISFDNLNAVGGMISALRLCSFELCEKDFILVIDVLDT